MSADPVGINGVAEINKLNDSSLDENVDVTKSSGSPSSKSEANSLPTSPKDAKAENIIVNHSPEYQKLIEYGLDDKVANRLEEIYKTGLLTIFTLQIL